MRLIKLNNNFNNKRSQENNKNIATESALNLLWFFLLQCIDWN